VRTGPPSASRRHARKAGTETERSRWFQLALEVGATFPTAIHVMDREADSYEIASELIAGGARFVIRICRDRILAGTQGRETTMFRAAESAPAFAERTVPLSRRQGSVPKRARKIHPRRKERVAALKIRASTHVLKRPNRRALDSCPPSLSINMVQVDEVNPPPGEDPVSWKLLTTESIGSAEEVEAIVDAYRARWVIEEYFKALKTGCAFERRQLESFRTLVNALAIFSVIAWRLLLLRFVARSAPSAPAAEVLTDRQVEVLAELSRMRESTAPRVQMPDKGATAADALRAVAQLGGHLKNNGPPGWQVLGRGYESLLLIELGWRAREGCDR
jgi:Transposase DDE domain